MPNVKITVKLVPVDQPADSVRFSRTVYGDSIYAVHSVVHEVVYEMLEDPRDPDAKSKS